ncbi:hypothetical protein EVAR_3684_1 [Eumeta japonica]|uniref:Uncharacterized protein n=1 Tax=Eumeta variegata TaxID=151549 RepID=A0A4C1SU18_EUMVA|nr:hypothetical protein EVAR_3684_1 [Eumeta japonica]
MRRSNYAESPFRKISNSDQALVRNKSQVAYKKNAPSSSTVRLPGRTPASAGKADRGRETDSVHSEAISDFSVHHRDLNTICAEQV